MKKIYLVLFVLSSILISCSTEEAEKVADEFHDRINKGEIDYVMENLVDYEASDPEMAANFRSVLELIHSWGKHENRTKSLGYNKKFSNGVTTVKLSYTFDVDGEHMYERLVLVKRDEGYKVLVVSMHPDESIVDQYTVDY